MSKKLLALYGLKYNPFSQDVPVSALSVSPAIESFCWRIENQVGEGGFGLVTGDPGTGKSAVLRILRERLGSLRDLSVGILSRPQASVADFYRELGDLFAVELKPHSRWMGFKALRQRWLAHLESSRLRPVLLIDEAQQMSPKLLSELRLLTSTHFDSRQLLSVVLAGDRRLLELLRHEELLPLGSRIRVRLTLEYATRDELVECLKYLTRSAGQPKLLTDALIGTLADHAMGNYRALTNMAAELLAVAAQRELPQLDEKLYLDVFDAQGPAQARRRPQRRTS